MILQIRLLFGKSFIFLILLVLTIFINNKSIAQLVDSKLFPQLRYGMTLKEIKSLGGDYADCMLKPGENLDWLTTYYYVTVIFENYAEVNITYNHHRKSHGVNITFMNCSADKALIKKDKMEMSHDCKTFLETIKKYFNRMYGYYKAEKDITIFYIWHSRTSRISLGDYGHGFFLSFTKR